MSALQWALLILSVVIVVAVVAISRRDRVPTLRRDKPRRAAERAAPPEPVKQQLEIFGSSPAEPEPELLPDADQAPVAAELLRPSLTAAASPVEPAVRASDRLPERRAEAFDEPASAPPSPLPLNPLSSTRYDEFGVGRARRRVAPSIDAGEGLAPAAPPPEGPVRTPMWARTAPERGAEPSAAAAVPPPPAAVAADKPRVESPIEPKVVALLVVGRDGSLIAGPRLHAALAAQGLSFGAKQIYHRLAGGDSVFGVASLVKPGFLIPGDAAQFSTPGLQVFMVLPGPVKPLTALQDLLATTQALSRALNAEVYDIKKQPLSSETMRTLQADVDAWARSARL